MGYPSDLTDEQWAIIGDLFEARTAIGGPFVHERRLIVNAILYQSVVRQLVWTRAAPAAWDHLGGVVEVGGVMMAGGAVHQRLQNLARAQSGHDPGPGAAVLDAQSVPNAGPAEEVGYDVGKKFRGRKRHIIVDSLGLLIGVLVTSASISDIAGGHKRLRKVRLTNSMVGIVRCDSGYQKLDKRAKRLRLKIEIVKNPSRHSFIPVRDRWIVERSLTWFSAQRRLGKRDLEHTVINAETWVKVASIAMMLNRLHPKPGTPQAVTWAPHP